MEGDHDRDGKLSFEEFAQMVSNTVSFVAVSPSHQEDHAHTPDQLGYRETNDAGRFVLANYVAYPRRRATKYHGYMVLICR